MVALRSLNTDEREDMLAELADTRRERSRIIGAIKRHPDSEKLRWQLDAYDRCVSRYERDLGLVVGELAALSLERLIDEVAR